MRTLDHASDTELIRAFQDGDTDAFETLIYRYKDKIFSSILFFVKDTNIVKDTIFKLVLQHKKENTKVPSLIDF